ncbi:MAG: methyl-accepting chemotaxis protein [Planctomycetota bacterium]
MGFTIRTRLVAGLGVLVLILVGVGGVSLLGFRSAERASNSLGEMAHDMTVGAELLNSSLMSRMSTVSYFAGEREQAAQDFETWTGELDSAIAQGKQDFQNPERVAAIAEIQGHAAAFEDAFGTAREVVRNLEQAVIEMHEAGKAARQELTAALETALEAERPDLMRVAGLSVQDLLLARLYAVQYIQFGRPEDLETHLRWDRAFAEALQSAPMDGPCAARFEAALAHAETFRQKFADARALRDERVALVNGPLAESGVAIQSLSQDIEKSLITDVEHEREATSATIARKQVLVVSAVAAGGVFAVLIAVLLLRAIITPIRAIVERLQEISDGDGDLTVRLRERGGDELAELGLAFNNFVRKLAAMVQSVREVSGAVAHGSDQVAAAATEIAASLEEQDRQAAQVSAAIEEMSAAVTEVARNSAEASDASERGRTNADEGRDVVAQTVLEVEGIATEVRESAQIISRLGAKSEQIGEIVSVINDIADQTNLLALNAAIEAARAGEHGRGFAVVADEVRKLAERTTVATEEVTSSIREIQEATRGAVTRIESSTGRADRGSELATSADVSLQSILGSTEELLGLVRGIAAATEQQSAASEEIARSIEGIASGTRESSAGARLASESAVDLNTQVERLRNAVLGFTIEDESAPQRVRSGREWMNVPAA